MRHRHNQRQRETQSFWQQLEMYVNQIGNRARDKLVKYQQKQFHTIKQNPECQNKIFLLNHRSKQKQQKSKIQPNISLQKINKKELVKLQKIENERKNMIANRLAYFQQDKDKQSKTIELAKRKYSLIVSIRKQSFKQKNQIKKKLTSIENEEKASKTVIVKQVKSARDKKHTSMQNWKCSIQRQASQIRKQTINNQSFVVQQKKKVINANVLKANETRQGIQKSRSIVSEANDLKILRARKRSRQQLSQRFKSLNQKKKSNQFLFAKLQMQVKKIDKWKQRASKQIDQYRSYLGIKQRRSQILSKQNYKTQSSTKSFYLTNY